MNPSLALLAFYLLLALAVVVLRGEWTEWPRSVDRMLGFAIALGAVVLLLRSWKSHQPESGPADDGSSRPRPTWWWWLGMAGLAAFVFLAALPPLSVMIARPQPTQTSAEKAQTEGQPPASPIDAGTLTDGEIPEPGPGETDAASATVPPDSSGASAFLANLRAAVHQRPRWLLVFFFLMAAGCAALLWWHVRRQLALQRSRRASDHPPVPWHRDPVAPAYVREFCRLCEHVGCVPRPGDTWRELLGRLQAAGSTIGDRLAPLEPVARYHYQVRYEGVPADQSAEREFVRLIRGVRKAATFPPATETAKAA